MINHSDETEYIQCFDGARGIACLAVFFVHFQQKVNVHASVGPFQLGRFLENGNTGVALFFALSGFVLSLPFWQANRQYANVPSYPIYLIKRIVRILPAFYLCLTALVIHNGLWEDRDKWDDIVLHYAFLFNFSEDAVFRISQPFWTLAVEMQFYLFLPVFFLFPRLIAERWRILLISFFGITAYFCYYAFMYRVEQVGQIDLFNQQLSVTSPVLTYTLFAHLSHFTLGIVAAYIYLVLKKNEHMHRYRLQCGTLFWCSSLTVILILSTSLDDWLQIPYGRYNLPYVPVLIAAILATLPFCMLANRLLCLFPVKAIGIISYGVYLFHLPCQNLTARVMNKLGFLVTDWWFLFLVASLVFTIVVSSSSFFFIERPLLKFVKARTDRGYSLFRLDGLK